jgi:hypothetical protein
MSLIFRTITGGREGKTSVILTEDRVKAKAKEKTSMT